MKGIDIRFRINFDDFVRLQKNGKIFHLTEHEYARCLVLDGLEKRLEADKNFGYKYTFNKEEKKKNEK